MSATRQHARTPPGAETALLRQVVEHASDCILLADGVGRVTLLNHAAMRTFGYAPAEAAALPLAQLFPVQPLDAVPAEAGLPGLAEALRRGAAWSGEIAARRRNGARFPAHVSLAFAASHAGDAPAPTAILYLRDVSDQQRLLDRLRQLSIVDDLTGAYNVRYLWARLRYEFLRARRYQQPLACLMADLDRFKAVNDTYGHRTGDDVLRMVSQKLARAVRQVDIAARYGGEEFAVILPNTRLDGAMQCAEHIRVGIERASLMCGATPVKVTLSIGVAELNEGIADEEEFLRRADEALLEAKRLGRNRVCASARAPAAPARP